MTSRESAEASWDKVTVACAVSATALLAGATLAHADAPRTFFIEEYRVEGNTVLPSRDIESAVYGFLGPDRTADDIEHARTALENLYQKRGYPTVTVELPRQAADTGVIHLTVTERRIGRLRVTNAQYHEPDLIRKGAPSLAPGVVPNINKVRQDMVALNRQPGPVVTPELKPGREPDTMDVDLNVTDSLPLHGSLELNNRRSADTTPLRLVGAIGYDNLWQNGDSINLFFQVAPENTADAVVWSAAYTFRIPNTDLSLVASFLKSDSNVASGGGTNVVGKGEIAGLRLNVPFASNSGFTHGVSLGADYKNFSQDLNLAGQGNHVPLTYYPFTLSYNASWIDSAARTDWSSSAIMGTPEFGSRLGDLQANRAYTSGSFVYFKTMVAHQHELPWGLQLWGRFQGQASADPLVPNEQFAAGGVDTVRGYLEAEVLGDNAADFQIELRSPSFASAISPKINELRIHLFADTAITSNNRPLPAEKRSYSLSAVGFGIRARFANHLSATFENAFTLSDALSTKRDADALLFRILGDF